MGDGIVVSYFIDCFGIRKKIEGKKEFDMSRYKEFLTFRQKMNKKIIEQGNMEMKRFFALDERVYKEGCLDKKTKELIGLTASLVLRCDDCIFFHLIQAKSAKVSMNELFETFSIALTVGGSTVIPHIRKAVAFLEELQEQSS